MSPTLTPAGSIAVLLAAGGAAWETAALRELEDASPTVVLLKRCLDLTDLLATAGTGAARAAVIGSEVAGLDADTVAVLDRSGVRVVVVHPPGSDLTRLARLGVSTYVDVDQLGGLADAIAEAVRVDPLPQVPASEPIPTGAPRHPGSVIAVWGPTGAPGRTTVAVGLAAELAQRKLGTLLLDVDPYGGAVAQHLGVLDQVSGLLAAARLANAGQLDEERLAAAARSIGPAFRVLTGLPRADRWVEVRAKAFEELLRRATYLERYVVADTGFSLEGDADVYAGTTTRNTMTLTTLARADQVVVVGAADPVGLTRLVRALHDLAELFPHAQPIVVVNRMRGSLGWSEREVGGVVADVAPEARILFLSEDRAAADHALMSGRSLAEAGDSGLRRDIAALASAVGSPVSKSLAQSHAGVTKTRKG